MSSTALYTDLSGYYDLMCADINYQEQSDYVHRLHQIFGNQGNQLLDLACGTGPHVRHFINLGYNSSGLDINQPMLDIAQKRCPEATFFLQDMSQFKTGKSLDVITCFLYSIHYNQSLKKLQNCILSTYQNLNTGGIFCFNTVNKNTIDNRKGIKHSQKYNDAEFSFQSNWYYSGEGDQQLLQLQIEKTTGKTTEIWSDNHTMVAIDFHYLLTLLEPYFEVHLFEHDFSKIVSSDENSTNAIFLCIKK